MQSEMHRRTFVATIAASGVTLAVPPRATAQTDAGTPAAAEETTMSDTTPMTGYADVNGLQMYYEIHGEGGVPLVLLHGGISTIDVDFSGILPGLAETRQVIGIEQQGHGHTGDIDRPLSTAQMADDTAALLQELGFEQADFVGYSVGAGIAMELAIRYPELVRKLVFMTLIVDESGYHPGHLEGMAMMQPEMLTGSPFAEAYAEVAPNPDDWPALIDKLKQLDAQEFAWPEEEIQAIEAPTLLVMGDSDAMRPEHMVGLLRLLGGGVPGDLTGLPKSQLAILPGATHVSLVTERADLLLAVSTAFLDAPMQHNG